MTEMNWNTHPSGKVVLDLGHYQVERRVKGVHKPELLARKDVEGLILTFHAFVLREEAGPVVEDRIVYDAVNFPRWIQRRWTRRKELHLRVQPLYTYPKSSMQIRNLNDPVLKFRSDITETDGSTNDV